MLMCQMIYFLITIFFFTVYECANNCKKLDQYCYCDDKCYFYGDCCPGYSNFNKTGTFDKILSCKNSFSTKDIWVIDKCRNNDHPLTKYCAKSEIETNNRLQSLIPVISDEGFIFENKFCALCNSKAQFQYLKINIRFFDTTPKNFDEVNGLINNGSSHYIQAMIPSKTLRTCHKNIIRICPPDFNNRNITYLCQYKPWKDVMLVRSGSSVYRNEDCCSCWNQSCFPIIVLDATYSTGFSYILNFNQWVKEDTRLKPNNSVSNITLSTGSEKAIYYVSFILTTISLLSLVVLVIIYVSQRVFHTFGGYLTICLCCCLFMMNFLTLLIKSDAISKSKLCRFFGIFQHFIALSNFIWMAIYALDLLQTFGFEKGNKNKKKSLKRFMVYCIFGFGFDAIIVGAAVIVEFNLNTNSTIKPLYGGEHCWFTSKLGGIIWYFIPICILLIFNLYACIMVFYKLSKTAKECKSVKQNESNTTLWLCVRLTAVFGIGYILQIIAILSGVYVFIIAGSLLNCLQGCLLAACFIWTKRVLTIVSTTIASVTGSTGNPFSNQTQTTKETKLSRDDEIN